MITYNNQLKENAIRQAQQDISQLTNLVFSRQNRIDHLYHVDGSRVRKVEELQDQLQQNQDGIASTRDELENTTGNWKTWLQTPGH